MSLAAVLVASTAVAVPVADASKAGDATAAAKQQGAGHGGAGAGGRGNGNRGGGSADTGVVSGQATGARTTSGAGSGAQGNGKDKGNRGRGNGQAGGGGATGQTGGGAGARPPTAGGSTGTGGRAPARGGSRPAPTGTPSPRTASPSSSGSRKQRSPRRPLSRQGDSTAPLDRRDARPERASRGDDRRRRRAGTRAAGRGGDARAGVTTSPAAAGGASARGDSQKRERASRDDRADRIPREESAVARTIRDVVEVIPGFIKGIIAALVVALLIASAAWFLLARNARFLRRQREKLVGEIGVLQGALLPNVPLELNRLEASVAYRPAEGLAAGGDFYDAFPLDDGRVGIVVGDVAGHGKEALMHTALLRYTMRAYLEAGLQPRAALQVAGRVLDRGFDTLATVVLAVYDPGRHILRYATAGHPPPVFLGEADHVPVTRASSPPIGAMLPTGLRQTTVSLPAGSAACFFTDGLIEARRDGHLIGRLGLVEMIRDLGPRATASELLDRVAREADAVGDDMAACMFRVSDGPAAEDSPPRVEELELRPEDTVPELLVPFLEACGVSKSAIHRHVSDAERTIARSTGALVSVAVGSGQPHVDVAPANVESLAAAQAVRLAL